MTIKQQNVPVETVETGSKFDNGVPEKGTGLCLSGGGYRAMLFHTGAVWRLNEAGFLPKLDRISSVSGGSIIAAVLGLNWEQLTFNNKGVAENLLEKVINPIRNLAAATIDRGAILGGALGPGSIGEKVTKAYKRHLFGDATLQALPNKPRFVINATNVQSGVIWRFMKPYMRDYRVGEVKNPQVSLAVAVAASSAFPPFLSPVFMELEPSDFTPNSGKDLQQVPYTTDVYLSDGGVYDNLGLETVWKRYDTVLVSDGGGQLQPEAEPKVDWARHTYRVLSLIDNQVRSLRKRQLIESFVLRTKMLAAGENHDDPLLQAVTRQGAYWGIRSHIADFHLDTALDCPPEQTTKLAALATRLKRMDAITQERVINWGYAVCDAAIRKHVDSTLAEPHGFPYPQSRLG